MYTCHVNDICTEGLIDCATKGSPELFKGTTNAKKLQCYNTWDVIMVHGNTRNDFNKTQNEYKKGFGSFASNEYYLGNVYLNELTRSAPFMLRIDMWVSSTEYMHAEFNRFLVEQEVNGYRLELGEFLQGHAGTGGLLQHSGAPFSAPDSGTECASLYQAGFWYLNGTNECFHSLLTGYKDIVWKMDVDQSIVSVQKVLMRIQAKIDKG